MNEKVRSNNLITFIPKTHNYIFYLLWNYDCVYVLYLVYYSVLY